MTKRRIVPGSPHLPSLAGSPKDRPNKIVQPITAPMGLPFIPPVLVKPLIVALLAVIAVVIALTQSAYELRIKWGQNELEMRPTSPVQASTTQQWFTAQHQL